MAKLRAWAILAAVGIVAVLAGGWFLALSPQHSKVSKLHAQTASQQQANQALTTQIALLKKQQAQIPAEQARIAEIQGRIPNSPALTLYVRTLADLAGKNHVELVSVAPSPPLQVQLAGAAAAPAAVASPGPTGSGSAAGAATPGATTGANLTSIPVIVKVVGDYYSIQQFLAKLEDTKRATIVSAVQIQPGQLPQPQGVSNAPAGGSNSGADWHTLEAQISLSVFMSGSAATGTSGASAGAPAAPQANGSGTAAPTAAATTAPNN